jgi:hypothetical protein
VRSPRISAPASPIEIENVRASHVDHKGRYMDGVSESKEMYIPHIKRKSNDSSTA